MNGDRDLIRQQILVIARIHFVLLVVPCFAFAQDQPAAKVRLLLIGDSTVASYPNPPADKPDLTGWGQVFGEFFTDKVEVINHAKSGRSSKSPVGQAVPDAIQVEHPITESSGTA